MPTQFWLITALSTIIVGALSFLLGRRSAPQPSPPPTPSTPDHIVQSFKTLKREHAKLRAVIGIDSITPPPPSARLSTQIETFDNAVAEILSSRGTQQAALFDENGLLLAGEQNDLIVETLASILSVALSNNLQALSIHTLSIHTEDGHTITLQPLSTLPNTSFLAIWNTSIPPSPLTLTRAHLLATGTLPPVYTPPTNAQTSQHPISHLLPQLNATHADVWHPTQPPSPMHPLASLLDTLQKHCDRLDHTGHYDPGFFTFITAYTTQGTAATLHTLPLPHTDETQAPRAFLVGPKLDPHPHTQTHATLKAFIRRSPVPPAQPLSQENSVERQVHA